MLFQPTTALQKIASKKKKIVAVQGGTSSSKTISILMLIIDQAQRDDTPTLTSVVAESIPHLKRGALRDFKNIMQGHNYWNDSRWNVTDSIYTLETGSQIEFFSADQPDKLRGGRRDRLFMNECNNMHAEAFEQLEVRTKERVYLDWNPTNDFWFYTDVKKRDDVDHLVLTYKDNEGCPPEIVKSIEARKENSRWWTVYGLGQLGEIEGRIYTGWQEIDDIPHEARLSRRGLDFGYSVDPSCLADIYEYNGGFILDEQIYQKGLSNKAIADYIRSLQEPNILIIADSAEPKSIDEIKGYGVNIIGALKGPGSVLQGIQYVQGQRISITKRSTNILKAYRNYMWSKDKMTGRFIQTPDDSIHEWSNSMDAVRYGFSSYKPINPLLDILKEQQFTRNRSQRKLNSTR